MPGSDDDLLSGLGYGPAAAATDALNTVAPLDPDREAKNRQTARDLNLPQQVVRSAPDLAQTQVRRQAFQSPTTTAALQAAPNTAAWLAHPDNAAVAHDDLATLPVLGRLLLGVVTRVTTPGYFTGAGKDLTLHNVVRAAKSGVAQTAEGIAGVVERASELEDNISPVAWAERKVFGGSLEGGLIDLARRRRQAWEQAAQTVQQDAKSPFARDVLSGVQSIPGSLTAAGVTLVTGNPYAGAAVLGEVTAGQSYGEARDAGLTPAGALLKSAIDEVFETGTEILPEQAMLKFAHGTSPVGHALLDVFAKEVGGEQIATLGQDFNQWAMVDANKGKSFQDYVAQIGPDALSTLTATLTTIGAMAGPGTIYRSIDKVSGRAAVREARVQEAEAVSNHLKEMGQLAAASKLRERDPASFHDFVQQAAQDGPVEAVYVDPAKLGEVLNQSELEPEQADALRKSLADPVREALANGHDVRVPIEDFETHLAGTPAGDALVEHLKTDPNGMSLAEAKDFMANRGEELQAEVEHALTQATEHEAFRQSEERVQQNIAAQLDTANRFTKEVNAANANGMAAFYSTMAARLGTTPEELFAKYPIKVQAEGQGELSQVEVPQAGTYTVLPERRTAYRLGDPFMRFERRDDQGALHEYGSVYEDGVVTRYDASHTPLPVSRGFGDAMRAHAKDQGATVDLAQRTGDSGRPILSLRKPNNGLVSRSEIEQRRSEHELFQRDMLNGIFYSPLERAVESVSLKKADGKQWLATISKLPGVKKEELEWTGLPEWLASREGAFTKDEVQAFVKAGGVQVDEVELGSDQDSAAIEERAYQIYDAAVDEQFEDWANDQDWSAQIDYPDIEENDDGTWSVGAAQFGSEAEATIFADELADGYEQEARTAAREDFQANLSFDEAEQQAREEIGTETKFENYTEDGGEDYRELLLTLPEGVGGNPSESFRESGHFGEHPVVAHLRFKTRHTTDGRSVVFVEEVQSDWHQKGRDRGYKQEFTPEDKARAEQLADEGIAANRAKLAAERAILAATLYAKDPHNAQQLDAFVAPREVARISYEALAQHRELADEVVRATMRAGQIETERQALHEKRRAGVPDAPFKSSWPALAMKRAIRWAVDNGIEQIAWTTGEQQRERYNLAQHIGTLWVTKDGERYRVYGGNNIASLIAERGLGERYRVYGGNNIASLIAERGLGEADHSRNEVLMAPEQIAEVFGKDLGGRMVTLADQAAPNAELTEAHKAAQAFHDDLLLKQLGEGFDGETAAETAARRAKMAEAQDAIDAYQRAQRNSIATLDAEDLKIGGEGMLGFYDRNLVNIANKIIKPHGGAVTMLPVEDFVDKDKPLYFRIDPALSARQRAAQQATSDAFRAAQAKAGTPGHAALVEAWRAAMSVENAIGLEVHDAKVAAVQAAGSALPGTNPGFEITPELRQAAEQGFALFQTNRGAYSPAADTITLLKSANLSTFLHESGHFYLEMLDRLAADPNAPQQVKDDFDTVLKWFGTDAAKWRAMGLEQKRDSHEKWARGFEAYLFSGRAPSLRLQPLFQRFRNWLVAVYHKATSLGVKPTPQIREVMDRMLATDDEIAIAQQSRSMLPLFKDQASSGLDEHGWREYQRQADAATDDATSDLEARSLRDLKWIANARSREIGKLKRQARATRVAVTATVTREVMAEPVYRAMDYLKRGRLDGQPVENPAKLSIAAVDALYPDEATRNAIKTKLGYGAYGMLGTENAADPAAVAEQLGFTSADHMIRALADAPPIKETIAGKVEQRLLEDHGELTDEKQIEDAADKAIHSEARARVVATETAALNHLAGKPKMLASAARAYAKEIVSRLKVRNLKPSLYESAAARAGKNALDELGRGNRIAAAAEKRNQLINVYASKEAIAAKEEVDQALAYFKRLLRPAAAKSIDREYLDQIENLLGKVDLANATLRSIDRKASLAQWIEKQREIGLDPIVPDDLLDQLGQRSYKDMTVEEMRGLRDAIKNIEHLGRLKNKLLTAKRDRDFGHAVALLTDGITQFAYKDVTEPIEKRGWLAKAKEGVFDFVTDHRKLASLAREMDGMHDGGSVWEYFIRPMNDAASREAHMRSEAAAKLAEILAPIKSFGTKQFIPEVGQSLSLEGRLAVALNTGNAINRERLLTGEKWEADQLAAVLKTLDAEQWGVVQRVWDMIGSYWPEIAAKEARVTGVVPERVEPEPIEVVTADGQTLTLPGGYYPIKYNARRSSKAQGNDLAEAARQALLGARTAAQTKRGHTKARVESTGMALRYDLGVVTQHVTEVIHDLTHHEMLIDTTRLLRASPVDGAIRSHYGPEVRDAFRKTIEAVAAGDIPAQDAFERGVNYLRNGVTIAGLGWNLFTALFQPLGLSQSVMRIGPKWVGKGIARWVGDAASFENSVKWISAQSPMMAERSNTLMREINDIRNTVQGKSTVRTAVEASFFYLIGKMQLIADVPTWLGQYEKSVDAGEDHDRAVALADQAVLDSQGGGQMKDLAAIQRGNALKKLWTSFYSYFSVTYNLLAESTNDTRRVGKSRLPLLAADFLLLTMVPNTLTVLMRAALHGQPPDKDDVIGQNVAGLFNLMIGLREIGVLVGGGREAGPAGLFYGPFSELYKQVQQGEADEAFWRALNRAGGVLLHYPAGQVDRTVRGFEALANGDTHNPGALIVGPPVKQHG